MAKKAKAGKPKRRGSSVGFVIFLEFILGLIVGVFAFGYAYRYMSMDTDDAIDEKRFSANELLEQAQSNLMGSDIDAVVRSKDDTANSVTFYNLKNDTATTVTATKSTKFPRGVNINTLQPGDIVTYVFDEGMKLAEVKSCPNEWIIEDKGVAISTSSKLVKFTDASSTNADKSFKYVDGLTSVRYKDEIKELASISPYDYVSIHGYDDGKSNKVYKIDILKSHGELHINNAAHVNDMHVFVSDRMCSLNDNNSLYLTEGVYPVRITGSNTKDLIKTANIVPGSPYEIDLSQVVLKQGLITLKSNVKDYKIFIDGEEYPYGQSILMPYGMHKLRAVKGEYFDVVSDIYVTGENNPVELKFKKIKEVGTIKIKASPKEAEIFINDVSVGKEKAEQTLELGTYIVTCSCDGYKTAAKKVNLSVDKQTVDIEFKLDSDGSVKTEEESKSSNE